MFKILTEIGLDGLAYLPYWRGKGQVTLALLRSRDGSARFAAKMPYGSRIWIGADPVGQSLLPYWIGQYESQVISIFRQALAKLHSGENFIDVGANLGFYTVLAAGFLQGSPRSQVHAFEPHPLAFAELAKNVELNHFSNVKLYEQAVAARNGELDFYASQEGITLGSLHQGKDSESLRVEAVAIDSLRSRLGTIGLMKIDVEGAELPALQGARSLIERDQPIILFEQFDEAYGNFGYTMRDVQDFFNALDYRLFCIRPRFASNAVLEYLGTEPQESGTHYRNLVALPAGREW